LTRSLTSLPLCIPFVLASHAVAQSGTKSPDILPGTSWSHITSPEKAGWSKERLAAAHQYADADSIHTSAVMIVQGGEVVDQWGDIDQEIDS
jgi:hypothetical protein